MALDNKNKTNKLHKNYQNNRQCLLNNLNNKNFEFGKFSYLIDFQELVYSKWKKVYFLKGIYLFITLKKKYILLSKISCGMDKFYFLKVVYIKKNILY